MGQVEWGRGLIEMEGRVIKQDLMPYVRQQELANIPIEGQIIDLDYMASLMVVVILCASLPTVEKLPTLI